MSDGSAHPDAAHAAGARAAKNTALRAIGEIVGKLASFVLFAVLARETGAVGIGVYAFALAWGEVSMATVGLGIDRYMLRRVARDQALVADFFWNAFALKVARGIPVAALSIAVVAVLDWGGEKRWAVAIVTAAYLLDTLSRTLLNVFDAFERADLHAACITAERTVAAGLGLLALALGHGVVAVAAAFLAGTALKLALSFVLLARSLGMPKLVFPAAARRELRRKSLPFTAEDIFGLVLARIDLLMLSALAAAAVVGYYGAAYRLIEATTFIVFAIGSAFTAMFTYLGADTTPTLQSVYQRALKLTLTLLTPIVVAFAVVPGELCRAFFGADLEPAGDPLRLLAPVVLLFGVIVLSTNLVVSRASPMGVVRVVALVAVINIAGNAALIPPFEDQGAALAMLIADLVYVGLALRLALPLVGRVEWRPTLAAPVAAGAAMALAMLPLGLPLAAVLAIGTAVYLGVYAAIDALVAPSDLRFVVGLVARRFGAGRAAEAGSA